MSLGVWCSPSVIVHVYIGPSSGHSRLSLSMYRHAVVNKIPSVGFRGSVKGTAVYALEEEDAKVLEAGHSLPKDWFMTRESAARAANSNDSRKRILKAFG